MKASTLFAALVICQALHSIEETTFGLYDLLPYIYWADAFLPNGALGLFVLGNVAVVAFGAWCYFARVKPGRPSAESFVLLWVAIELFNGLLHPIWSFRAGDYIPGTATAPILLILALMLLWRWYVPGRESQIS